MLKQTLESLLFCNLFPRAQIDINVEVLQADGPFRAQAVNAVTLALIDAGLPIRDFLVACGVGYIDGHTLMDINGLEDSARGPDLCLAYMPNSEKLITAHLEPKLPLEALAPAMDLGLGGCKELYKLLQAAVLEHCSDLAAARGQTSI